MRLSAASVTTAAPPAVAASLDVDDDGRREPESTRSRHGGDIKSESEEEAWSQSQRMWRGVRVGGEDIELEKEWSQMGRGDSRDMESRRARRIGTEQTGDRHGDKERNTRRQRSGDTAEETRDGDTAEETWRRGHVGKDMTEETRQRRNGGRDMTEESCRMSHGEGDTA